LKTEDLTNTVHVIRDEKPPEVLHRNFISVGDIVIIKAGINIPVDGIVVDAI
jgi:cation transport ATPase